MKPLKREQLAGFGSLITIAGTQTCLAELVHFNGHGVFDPSCGLVPVTPEEATAHNRALEGALLEGMAGARVGQATPRPMYWTSVDGLRTFTGQQVAPLGDCAVRGRILTLTRGGQTWRGTVRDGGAVYPKRIA